MTNDIADRVDALEREASGVWASYGVTSWERTFLYDVKHRESLSAKQEAVLKQIEKKVFRGGVE